MKLKQACTLSLAALMTTGVLMTGCSGTVQTADDSSSDAAATAEDSTTRTVTGDDGVEVTIPAQVDRVAPTIGAFSQVTETLTQGNGKIVAAGAINVAADYAGTSSGSGTSLTVNAEPIVEWNPQYIIAMNSTARDAILADAALANAAAVKNGNVFTCPTGLYLWSVRSGEGAMMTPWLGTHFYPDLFSDVGMVQVVQDFYKTYYNYDLSDSDAQAIVNPDGE